MDNLSTFQPPRETIIQKNVFGGGMGHLVHMKYT